jgi:serine-type D-Ala-D-Ala carboxypeptidase (penicillin-binding protein 5/6)
MKNLCALLPLALAGWLVAGPPPLQAAASKSHKPSAAKSSHYTGFARDPYRGAIVVEAASGRVLFEDNADAKGVPASLVKLMDLLVIEEHIERGELSLHDRVPVSAKAAAMPESNVALTQKESFPVDELLYALMVRSANDAAVALAEKVGGTTDGFIELMNRKARELGLTNTVFHSVNGLPPAAGEQHSFITARELSRLCRELLKHKDTLRYTGTHDRVFRPNAGKQTVNMITHNHLLGRVEGCDGLKTGYIAASGFSIAVTAARNGQRIIVVVLDSIDMKTRDAKAAELVEKGFRELPDVEATPQGKARGKSKALLKPKA